MSVWSAILNTVKSVSNFLGLTSVKKVEVEMEPLKVMPVTEMLCDARVAVSRAEGRRMIKMGGIKIDGEKVGSVVRDVEIRDGMVVEVGKRRIARREGGEWKVERK